MLAVHMALDIVVMAVEMLTGQSVDEEHEALGPLGGCWYASQ